MYSCPVTFVTIVRPRLVGKWFRTVGLNLGKKEDRSLWQADKQWLCFSLLVVVVVVVKILITGLAHQCRRDLIFVRGAVAAIATW